MRNIGIVALALLWATTSFAAGHRPIVYSGELIAENGLPYTGAVDVSVRAWDAPEMGNEIWTQGETTVDVVNGVMDLELGIGDQAPLMAILAGSTEIWLSFEVDGEMLSPRQELTAHPYAAVAGNAQRLGGMQPSMFQLASDSVGAEALPTDGLNQISNGSLTNAFMNVDNPWAGPAENILDAEPGSDPIPTVATITTAEGAGSYLTGVAVQTQFSIDIVSQIEVVLTPPALTGVPAITLISDFFLPGVYADLWTIDTTPELADLLNQQVAGGWTLTVTDTDNSTTGNSPVGQLAAFNILYDVVRADELAMTGDLGIDGDLAVGGEAVISGTVISGPVTSERFIWATDADDGCNQGPCSARQFTYPKRSDSSALLIHWNDNWRTSGGSPRTCHYRIRVDGEDCTDPAPMQWALYMDTGSGNNNIHRSGSSSFACRAVNGAPIAAGDHLIQVWEFASVDVGDGQADGNCFLGWNSMTYFEVEEITF